MNNNNKGSDVIITPMTAPVIQSKATSGGGGGYTNVKKKSAVGIGLASMIGVMWPDASSMEILQFQQVCHLHKLLRWHNIIRNIVEKGQMHVKGTFS